MRWRWRPGGVGWVRGALAARWSTRERLTFHCGGVVSGCGLESVVEGRLQRGFELLWMGHARWG